MGTSSLQTFSCKMLATPYLAYASTKSPRIADQATSAIGSWPEIFRLLCENEATLAAIQELDRYVVAQVEAGVAAGEIDASLDPAAVVRAFYGLMGAIPKGRLGAVLLLEPPRTAEGLVEIFVRGVRAPERE